MRTYAILLVLWFIPTVGEATVLLDWQVDDVVAHADSVVIGTVLAQRHVTDGGRTTTETHVVVHRQLKGVFTGELRLVQLGGHDRERDRITDVVGAPVLRVGQEVLLLTQRNPDGRHTLVAMSLGVYYVDGDILWQRIDVPLLERSGALRPPPGRRAATIAEIEDAIERTSR